MYRGLHAGSSDVKVCERDVRGSCAFCVRSIWVAMYTSTLTCFTRSGESGVMLGMRVILYAFGFCAASSCWAQGHAADDAYTSTSEGLAALRAQAKSSYEKGDKRQLLSLSGVLDPMGKDKRLDISCRLAATGIAREVKGYIGGLDARDADARKIAESRVRIAVISVKRDLANCE